MSLQTTEALVAASNVYTWEPPNRVIAARYGLRPEDILRFDTNTSPAVLSYLPDVPKDIATVRVGTLRGFVVVPRVHPLATKKEIMNPRQRKDIHTYGFYLQHVDNCYDREIENRCAKCHEDKDVTWARRTLNRWRAPVAVDH